MSEPGDYRCPVCVGTGSIESSDSTDESWWDCPRCKGTGRLSDRRISGSDERFTEEALKSQDGKKVPLTAYPGGPVIGEATLKYDPKTGLEAQMRVDGPKAAEYLGKDASAVIFKKES